MVVNVQYSNVIFFFSNFIFKSSFPDSLDSVCRCSIFLDSTFIRWVSISTIVAKSSADNDENGVRVSGQPGFLTSVSKFVIENPSSSRFPMSGNQRCVKVGLLPAE